jgi:ABC-type uncharacterized transport system ATPase subunit
VEVRNTTIEITLREDEEALSLLTALRRQEGFLHFEITSTSLEDAFVQILDNKPGS